MTKILEEELSDIVGTKHIIMTTSATAALYLAIEADKRIKKYDEGTVVIPDLTFVATKNAVELAGLKVEYCDVNTDSFLMNYHLPSYKKHPRIVIPVNLLGRGVTIYSDGISTIICDNAGCLGSHVPNGDVGCYSLQANKMINCGQGGFCATDDDEYARVIREIKDFGRTNKNQNDTIGFNFKFNDIQAAVTLGQLEQLNTRKRLHIRQYTDYKDSLWKYGKFPNFNFVGEVPLWIEFITSKRDELAVFLGRRGIEARKPWKPFQGLPNSRYYYENCLWLPNGTSLSYKDQKKVIETIKEFYNERI